MNAPRTGKPILFWDGDCSFCRTWVERWKQATGDSVQYATLQDAPADVVEAAGGVPAKRIVLRTPDGALLAGARAALEALSGSGTGCAWLLWAHRRIPGVGALAEACYAWVADHRPICAAATRWLWGKDALRPTYSASGAVVPRLIGATFFAAFLSLRPQVLGLAGQHGILPAAEQFAAAKAALGPNGWLAMPSLLWLGASDNAMLACLYAGTAAAALLALGVAPAATAFAAWACYLSLAAAIPMFLDFQWDALLLEAGFLTVFYVPWTLWIGRAAQPARLGRVLLWLLLFRLMFESGVVKLHGFDAAGRNAWLDGSALAFHYFTQPIPAWTSWYLAKLPHWFHSLCVGVVMFVELLVPFFIFGPRRVRMFAFWSFVSLMLLIAGSGNYGFFNLLALALCASLADDASLPARLLLRPQQNGAASSACRRPANLFRDRVLPLVAVVTLILTGIQLAAALGFRLPAEAATALRATAPWRSANRYGLFSVMTTERPEITVEVSKDGARWVPLDFRYKVDAARPSLPFLAPHMPRLDWMMWFGALEYRETRRPPEWLLVFLSRLRDKDSAASTLLASPPPDFDFVRARLDLLTFTSAEERARAGRIWHEDSLPEHTFEGKFQNR